MLVLVDLGDLILPDDPEERKNFLKLDNKPALKRNFLHLLQDVLLLPYGVTQDRDVPAGLSPYAFKRLMINKWKAEDLEKVYFLKQEMKIHFRNFIFCRLKKV